MMTDSQESAAPSRPSLGVRIGRVAFLVVAAIVVVAVAAAFFVTWTIQRSFSQTDGSIELDGLQAEVTVQRDDRGIPTITADSTDDLFYAQGFVHAQDRFFEMDFRRHVTSGRVAEMFGSRRPEPTPSSAPSAGARSPRPRSRPWTTPPAATTRRMRMG